MFISENRKQNSTLNRRTFFLYILKLFFFSGVSLRLYDIQISESKKYKTLSKNNQIDLEIIFPIRGEIFDRNNKLLATNKKVFDIYIIPEKTKSKDYSLNLLSKFIKIDFKSRRKIIDLSKQTKKFQKIKVAENINWETLEKIEANKYNFIVIEDSADTLGAKINNKFSGYYSDISIRSFYGSHVINCAGNGGMLCASNQNWIKDAKILRSWGRSSSILKNSENIRDRLNYKLGNINYDAKFIFEKIGYNFEPSEIGAAFGLVQLKNLNKNSRIRKRNFNKHLNFISNYEDIFITMLRLVRK